MTLLVIPYVDMGIIHASYQLAHGYVDITGDERRHAVDGKFGIMLDVSYVRNAILQ